MIGGRRTMVRQSIESASPAELLTRVAGFTNDYIARLHGRTNIFATVFLGALDTSTGRLDYVNAGHEPAILEEGVRRLAAAWSAYVPLQEPRHQTMSVIV